MPRSAANVGRIARPRRRPGLSLASCLACTLFACTPEAPPSADNRPPSASQERPARLDPGAGEYVLTHAADRGKFTDASNIEDVPVGFRGAVRVHLLDGPRPPAGKIWVANLDDPADDGGYVLRVMSVTDFEDAALQGKSSRVKLPEGLELPDVVPASEKVIVYKTDWCGVCKKAIAFLEREGIPYEAKDIEKDRAAAAELQAKAKEHGVPTGSVPVIDVNGTLMVGFDKKKLESLL